MRPGKAVNDLIDGVMAHSEQCADGSSRQSLSARDTPDLTHLRFSQSGITCAFAPGWIVRTDVRCSMTMTLDHIATIVGSRPKVEMVRPYTGRVVAVVEHTQRRRNGSVQVFVNKSMRSHNAMVDIQDTVGASTKRLFRACPDPTIAGLVDKSPEPNNRSGAPVIRHA